MIQEKLCLKKIKNNVLSFSLHALFRVHFTSQFCTKQPAYTLLLTIYMNHYISFEFSQLSAIKSLLTIIIKVQTILAKSNRVQYQFQRLEG